MENDLIDHLHIGVVPHDQFPIYVDPFSNPLYLYKRRPALTLDKLGPLQHFNESFHTVTCETWQHQSALKRLEGGWW